LQVPSKPAPPSAAPDALGRALLPLRAFLGFTFCFAGLQKLANPRFFDAADPASIQAQLAGATRRSPIHALISPLTHVAVPLGILIALGELAVGVGTLLGFRARLAAAGGLVLSFMLFLTVSFHSAPYYTGADIVFVFAWTPLLLAGSGSVLSLDAAIPDWAGRHAAAVRRQARRSGAAVPEVRRREVLLRGVMTAAVAGVSLLIGGLAAGLGRLAAGTAGKGGGSSLPSASAPVPAGTARPSSSSASKPGKVPSGTAIGPAADVPVGQAASFRDPATGDPSIVIQPRSGQFLAFDAVCPHAGCTVGYDPTAKVIVCPCHGSQFNASTGAVEVGPAATGLKRLAIAEGSDGQLYVT
jgi:thiosulfate dehydrogenase [quinone] large subunit